VRSAEDTATRPPKEGEVDRVYRLIKAWILQGQARPGEFVSEVGLARLCKTSRTPVREACNRLAQEHWITHIRHKGYLVPPISVREIVDVYEYRKLLETFAVEKAAAVATPEQLAGLRRIVELERKPHASFREVLPTNRQLHLGIAEIAGNRRVVDQLRLTLEYVDRLDLLSLEKDTTYVGHEEIVRALAARDPRAARRAMARHLDCARDRMLKLFGS
jgi:DNA-binding GntR family transcriptional regulator